MHDRTNSVPREPTSACGGRPRWELARGRWPASCIPHPHAHPTTLRPLLEGTAIASGGPDGSGLPSPAELHLVLPCPSLFCRRQASAQGLRNQWPKEKLDPEHPAPTPLPPQSNTAEHPENEDRGHIPLWCLCSLWYIDTLSPVPRGGANGAEPWGTYLVDSCNSHQSGSIQVGSAWSLLATAARNSDSQLGLQIRPAYGFQLGLTGCVTLNSSLNLSVCSSIKWGVRGPSLWGCCDN